MGKQKAPTPPNPVATANAQTTSNRETAITQAGLNSVDQITPYGNLTYAQQGKWPDGTPRFVATTTLSPAQQALLNTTQGTQQSLAETAQQQAGRLNGILAEPFSLDNDVVEGRLMELGRKRLDPILSERADSMETELINRGIRPGSTNYDRAQRNKFNAENDAYTQLLLGGRQQAVSEALTERNQPLNEIIGLASGTQVQSPQFTSTPQTGVAGTDVAGITQNAYNQQYNSYLNQQQQQNSLLGGLFGLGSNLLMFSDERLKEDIEPTGAKVRGVPVKSWTWKGTGERDLGVIAQDVEKKHPRLVDNKHPSGFKRVNYGKLMGAA